MREVIAAPIVRPAAFPASASPRRGPRTRSGLAAPRRSGAGAARPLDLDPIDLDLDLGRGLDHGRPRPRGGLDPAQLAPPRGDRRPAQHWPRPARARPAQLDQLAAARPRLLDRGGPRPRSTMDGFYLGERAAVYWDAGGRSTTVYWSAGRSDLFYWGCTGRSALGLLEARVTVRGLLAAVRCECVAMRT
jgi:hypothetical protein